MNKDKLIACHFTTWELEYIRELMVRDRILTEHVNDNLKELRALGVRLEPLEPPNMTGKLLSYIKKGSL